MDRDADGICDAEDTCTITEFEIGQPCDDGNPATIGDVLNSDCSCAGTLPTTVDAFQLVNASTGAMIMTLTEGSVIDIATIAADINVVAITNVETGSIRFTVDNVYQYNVDNTAPYCLLYTSPSPRD